MRLLLAIAASLLLATAASAAPDQKPAPVDKVICKRIYEADTGSHFQTSKRICRTASEWKEIDEGTERVMKTIREHSGVNPGDLAPTMGGSGPN